MRGPLILTLTALACTGCERGGPGGATWLAPPGLPAPPNPRPPDTVLMGGLSGPAEPPSAEEIERQLAERMRELSAVLDRLEAASEEGWRLQTELLQWFKQEFSNS